MYEKILKARKTVWELREGILWAKHSMTIGRSNYTSTWLPKIIGNRLSKKSFFNDHSRPLWVRVHRQKQLTQAWANAGTDHLRSVHTMEYDSAMKGNEILIHAKQGWTWKPCSGKEVRCKKPHIVWLPLYKISELADP